MERSRAHAKVTHFFPRYPFFSFTHSTLDLRLSRHWTGTICTRNDKSTSPPSTPHHTFAHCPRRRHMKQVPRRGEGEESTKKSPAARTGRDKTNRASLLCCFFAPLREPDPPSSSCTFPRHVRPPASPAAPTERAVRILRFLGFLFHSIKCFYDPLSCYYTVPCSVTFLSQFPF
jgi:hypothetical protein